MSLLLDARKKSQAVPGDDSGRPGAEDTLAAGSHQTPPSRTPPAQGITQNDARMAGQNLFRAKSPASPAFAGIHRNLLLALAGTVLLLAAGGGYVWYVTSANSTPPLRHVARSPAATPAMQQPRAAAEAPPEYSPPRQAVSPLPAKRPGRKARPAETPPEPTPGNAPLHIERHEEDSIDPLLNRAYLAYREGRLDQAQQLYLEAFRMDERNADALRGLAAIAQRRGADAVAAHYYAKVLELDPRDAVANAGMSALTTSSNIESRLKILIHEQPDSAPLHFALGNFYAAQERWGEAQQAYFSAYRLDPENAGLTFNLAVSLDRLGQAKPAAQHYRSALRLDAARSEGLDHAKISQRIEELTR